MPVGEPLAVLVYDEKDLEAFNHLVPYRPSSGEETGAGIVGAEGPADGTELLKFLHKLVRGGQIRDKGACLRCVVWWGCEMRVSLSMPVRINNPVPRSSHHSTPHSTLNTRMTQPTEFAKRLQALARHEDKELLRVFEASFEGEEGKGRREEDFDFEFFLENAHGVVGI